MRAEFIRHGMRKGFIKRCMREGVIFIGRCMRKGLGEPGGVIGVSEPSAWRPPAGW